MCRPEINDAVVIEVCAESDRSGAQRLAESAGIIESRGAAAERVAEWVAHLRIE